MQAVAEIEAVAGQGLREDRYWKRSGYWTGIDECQVTLIESEDLEAITAAGIQALHGEHRRNLVTRGIRLPSLVGRQFRVGSAVLEYDRPRPPCRYIQSLTQPGMTRALARCGGICARVVQTGVIRVQDTLQTIEEGLSGG